VAKALPLVVGDEAEETAKFASTFDSFFDILNVSNFTFCGRGERAGNMNGYKYRSIPLLMQAWI